MPLLLIFPEYPYEIEHHSQLLKLDTIIMFKVHSTCITRSFKLPKQNNQLKSYFFYQIIKQLAPIT